MKDEQELRRRLGQINTSIDDTMRQLRDFDPNDMSIDEGALLQGIARRLVNDLTAHYWLMSVLEEER